ncbi:Similar to Kinesin light chain 2; acc. no. Q9H0B6 [Pyronema omphalodes CBS 100304]|uniref:Similar to Kinesin light chain 2 acc. no. Q9H0B6 n=1 Tax=Pyronema omphalodes (strain CBS 100304) TaxID=1076935 RepID=U4KTU1_PYROM|nr:Similar to Kinesin light chain 2; acc. no. Q9H0B6 [Pyronema omphalodes CBS 100304]
MFEDLDSSYPNETLVNSVEYIACVYSEIAPQKACELRSQVFEARRRIHGIEHPITLSALDNFVCAYSRRGYWAESEKLQLQIIQARVKTLGPTHTDTIQAAANYALILMKLQRVEEAIESFAAGGEFGCAGAW